MNRKFIFDSNCVLKSIFDKEENLDILKDFIEVILDVKIVEIHQRKDYEYKNIFEKNLGFASVTILTDTDTKLNVGLQILDGFHIQNKLFLNYAQLYSKTIKTVSINIIDDEYFVTKGYHNNIIVGNLAHDGEHFKTDLSGELHLLELPKFQDEEIDTKEKAWMDYLKNGDLRRDIQAEYNEYEKILKLDKCLDKYWQSEEL